MPNRLDPQSQRIDCKLAAARRPARRQRVRLREQLAELQPDRPVSPLATSSAIIVVIAPAVAVNVAPLQRGAARSADGSNRRVRCTKNISSLRITAPLKSMIGLAPPHRPDQVAPVDAAGRSPRSARAPRRRRASSPCSTAPPTVNHHRRGPSPVDAGSEPQNSSTRPSSSSSTTRADIRRLTGPTRGRRSGPVRRSRSSVGSAAVPPRCSMRTSGPLPQRQGVADGVVVEPAGQQHPRLGVGELGDQRDRHRRRVDHRQRRGQRRSRRASRADRGARSAASASAASRLPSGAARRRRRRPPHGPPRRAAPAPRPAPARTGRSARAAGPAGWRSERPARRRSAAPAPTSTASAIRSDKDPSRRQPAPCAPAPATVS